MRNCKGFSLLEVLVAFAFFALAGTALFGVFSTALRNASAAEEYTRATLIAESKLAALGSEKAISGGTQSGEVEGERFCWSLDVRPYQARPSGGAEAVSPSTVPTALLGAKLVEAEVVVSWPGPRETSQRVTLTTLRLMPGE